MKDAYPFALTPDQFADSIFTKSRKSPAPPLWRHTAGALAGTFYGGMAALLAYAYIQPRMRSEYVLGVALAVLVAAFLAQWAATAALRRSLRRATHKTVPQSISLHEHGVRLESSLGETFYRWEAIADASIHGDLIYLNLDAVQFEPVPVAAFGSRTEAEEFVAFVNARIGAVREAGSPVVPLAPRSDAVPSPAALTTTRNRAGLGAAIGDALRIALFLPVDDDRPTGRWAAIFGAALASLAVPLLTSLWFVGANGEWSLFSLPSMLVHIPLLLAAAIASAYALGTAERVSRIFMAGLLVSIAIDVLFAAISALIGKDPAFARFVYFFQWIPATWLALAVATYAGRLVEPGLRRLGVLVSCALLLALPLTFIYRDRTVWHVAYDASEGDLPKPRRNAGGEDVLYAQPGLLAQELAALRPGRPGVIDVFHIGFAGYGDQDVFRKEVDAVGQLFRERFGAEGHAIRLVNSPKTLLDVPIASKTSLRAALKRVAEVMDKDEDVLVLFMTSHGSKQHRFSLTLSPITFHEIDPAVLRQLLDESGIRNRVVVVSACYSGGFVKPLESDDTLVITASDADRSSFGCTNEAEWTYFGKAYFDEALRNTYSFREAFDAAKPVIAERETQAKFDGSQPQISMGSRIAVKLADLERQLAGGAPPPRVPAVAAATAPGREDKYEQYVALMYSAEYLEELKKDCLASMDLVSPVTTVAKRADAYQGLEKSPRHWKRLNAAWDAYASGYCAATNDNDKFREVYGRKVRAIMREDDIDFALAHLRTERGAHWLKLDHQITHQQGLELARWQSDVSDTLYKRFQDEQNRIFDDFRKTG